VVAVNRPGRLIIAALLVLGVGWSIAPHSALPLYDGIGFPDEPYRFVQRPAGAQETKAPTTAHGTASVSGGSNAPLVAASAESAPQISLYIPKGKLTVPAGTSEISLTGTPVKPLPTGKGQYLWSDVYTVSASPGSTVFKTGGSQATITLRAASAQRPQPSIAYYDGNRWHLMPTFAQGRDIYIAELTRFGQFAVIGPNPLLVSQLSGSSKGGGGSSAIGVIVGIGVGVIVVVLFVLGRLRRARARAAAEADEYYDDTDEDEEEEDEEQDEVNPRSST
jgi:hypothetical protein